MDIDCNLALHTLAWDTVALEEEIARLMKDSDVSNKRGIYPYVLDRKEHHLNIRAFDDNTRREIYEKQMGICPHCGKHFDIEFMEADHINTMVKRRSHRSRELPNALPRM